MSSRHYLRRLADIRTRLDDSHDTREARANLGALGQALGAVVAVLDGRTPDQAPTSRHQEWAHREPVGSLLHDVMVHASRVLCSEGRR